MISSFLEQYTHTQYTIVISLLKKTDFDLIAVGGLDVGSRNPDESELPELSDRSASGSTSRTLELCPWTYNKRVPGKGEFNSYSRDQYSIIFSRN